MSMTKANIEAWHETVDIKPNSNQERYLVRHSLIENDNYIGYVEMCYFKDTEQYNINYLIRLNHTKGLPKLTIEDITSKCSSYKEANLIYVNFKRRVEGFLF